jgi:hypothetical protein
MPTTSQEPAMAIPGDLHDYLVSLIKQATVTYLAQESLDIDVEQLPVDLRF